MPRSGDTLSVPRGGSDILAKTREVAFSGPNCRGISQSRTIAFFLIREPQGCEKPWNRARFDGSWRSPLLGGAPFYVSQALRDRLAGVFHEPSVGLRTFAEQES